MQAYVHARPSMRQPWPSWGGTPSPPLCLAGNFTDVTHEFGAGFRAVMRYQSGQTRVTLQSTAAVSSPPTSCGVGQTFPEGGWVSDPESLGFFFLAPAIVPLFLKCQRSQKMVSCLFFLGVAAPCSWAQGRARWEVRWVADSHGCRGCVRGGWWMGGGVSFAFFRSPLRLQARLLPPSTQVWPPWTCTVHTGTSSPCSSHAPPHPSKRLNGKGTAA